MSYYSFEIDKQDIGFNTDEQAKELVSATKNMLISMGHEDVDVFCFKDEETGKYRFRIEDITFRKVHTRDHAEQICEAIKKFASVIGIGDIAVEHFWSGY